MAKLSLGLRLDEIAASGGGGITVTNCLTPLIQLSDGWYGFDTTQTPTGVISPTHTSDLQLIYSFKFDTVSGDWILQLGDAGDEPSPNATNGVLQFNLDDTENILFTWSDANLRYEGNDITSAEAVALHEGIDVCFVVVMVPAVLIWYDFAELKVRTDTPYVPPAPATFEMFTTSSTPNPFEVTFKSPIGTSLSINEVVYEGNDDMNVVASVSWVNVGDRIPFLESVEGCLTYFKLMNVHLSGEVPDFANNVDMTYLYIYGNTFTGTLPSISNNELLDYYAIDTVGVSGNIPDFSNNPLLARVYLKNNNLTGSIPYLSSNTLLYGLFLNNNNLTGDIPSLAVNTTINNIYLYDNQLTGFAGGNITLGYNFLAQNNLLTETAVDAILQGLVDGNTTGERYIQLETGNAAPSAAGEANIDILRGRGCTVTCEGGY